MDGLATWLLVQLDKDQEITERVRADAVAIRKAGNLARDPSAADRYDAQVRWATADNESKRRIIDGLHHIAHCPGCSGGPEYRGTTYECDLDSARLHVLRCLALPYVNRDGYREEWRP